MEEKNDIEPSHGFEGKVDDISEQPQGEFAIKKTTRLVNSPGAEWHKHRRLHLLKIYPSVEALFGRNKMTAIVHFASILINLSVAALTGRFAIWQVVAVAWTIGATADAISFAACHEYSHKLVTRSKVLNELFLLFGSVVTTARYSVYYKFLHLNHHRHLGAAGNIVGEMFPPGINTFNDPDRGSVGRMFENAGERSRSLANSAIRFLSYQIRLLRIVFWEGFFVGPKNALWHTASCYLRGQKPHPHLAYDALCVTLKIPMVVFLLLVAGPKAILYLLLAQLFFRGFLAHPFFGVWFMFHHGQDGVLNPSEENPATGSMHSKLLNLISMNLGYHSEHHDFPQIPWSRLGQLRKLAPKFYLRTPQSDSALRAIAAYVAPSVGAHFNYAAQSGKKDSKAVPETVS